nr:hypothetical protein GCM10020092_062880 [Actinoplanes digitatis]
MPQHDPAAAPGRLEGLPHHPLAGLGPVVDQDAVLARADVPPVDGGAQRHGAAAPVEHVEQVVTGAGDPQRGAVGAGASDHHAPRRAQPDAVGALDAAHGLLAEPPGEPGAHRDRVRQAAAVPVRREGVAERPDHGDRPRRAQRQQAVAVLQQHDRGPRRLPGEPLVLGAVDDVGGRRRVRIELRRVELAEPQADRQDVPDRGVHVGLGEQPAAERLVQQGGGGLRILGEAVHPGAQRGGEAGGVIGQVALFAGKVGAGARVADHQHVVVGPGAQLGVEQRAQVRGAAVDQVVGRHDRDGGAGGDRRAERGQLVLVQYPRRQVAGGEVPVGLVVVAEEVLERRRGAQVAGIVAAQARRVRGAEHPGQPRVLGVALLVASPARVAKRVDHRRPDVEPGADGVLVVQPAHLVADRGADPAHQVGVPGAAEADGLREDGGLAEPGDAVQRLGAGAERPDAEAGYRGLVLVQQVDLLGEGEPGEQVCHPDRQRRAGVLEGAAGGLVHGGCSPEEAVEALR